MQLQHIDESELTTLEFVDQLQQFRIIAGRKLFEVENWWPSHHWCCTKFKAWAQVCALLRCLHKL